jgi:hypothetical protein
VSIIRCGIPETVICVDGTAAFPKGNRTLELIWLLDSGRAQFVTLRWKIGALWIDLRPSDRHHFDAPPVPGKSPTDKRG